MSDRWHDFNRIGSLKRKVSMFLRLLTPGRIRNYLLNKREFAQRRITVSSVPPKVIFDTASVCNLRCPLCSTGAGILKQKSGYMRHQTFSSAFAQIKDKVCFVNLFNWGEPFLNPDIFKIIDEIYKSGAISHVHSNFSLKKRGLAEQIAASKLTSLVLSVDGASEETYVTYRQRGDWGLVQGNIRKFVQRRRSLGNKGPEIVWKFIVHKHNEHEVDNAVGMARDSGVDKLQLTAMWADLQPGLNDPVRQDQWAAEWLPVQRTEFRFDTRKQPLFDHACPFLWQDPVVNIDGTVSPCCFVNNSKYNFGDLKKNTFAEIWNNDKYRYSRSLFSSERYDGPRVRSICETCTLYRQVAKQSAEQPVPAMEPILSHPAAPTTVADAR